MLIVKKKNHDQHGVLMKIEMTDVKIIVQQIDMTDVKIIVDLLVVLVNFSSIKINFLVVN